MKIKIEDTHLSYKKELYINDKLIGDFVMDVDGYYYFKPITNDGYWNSNALRIIADYLDKINESYDRHVIKYFKMDE